MSEESKDVVLISLASINGDEAGLTPLDAKKVRAMRSFMAYRKVRVACEAAEISTTSWYSWIREDPNFRAIYQQVLETWAADVEHRLFERGIDDGDVQALIALLKAWNKSRYGDKQTIEIVSPQVGQALSETAAAIDRVVREALPDGGLAETIIGRIKSALREIWAKDAA